MNRSLPPQRVNREPVTEALALPEALLEWGRQNDMAVRFARPWADQILRLVGVAHEQGRALTLEETERLVNWLEALAAEAVRHGRIDLLLGFDTFTASWIGLRITLRRDDGSPIVIGRGGDFTWEELEEIHHSDDPKGALAFMERTKALLADAFPGALLTGLRREADEQRCSSCGEPASHVMLTTDTDLAYHMRCWLKLVRS